MSEERFDEWINAHEAAQMMSKKSGHPISSDYVRLLSNTGKIRTRAIDSRTKVYSRRDVEGYTVRKANRSPSSQLKKAEKPA